MGPMYNEIHKWAIIIIAKKKVNPEDLNLYQKRVFLNEKSKL